MALVGDIQLQDSAVKPPALDTSQKFSAEGLTATTAFAVTDAGAGNTVSTTGLITAKSSNDVNAWLQTTKADGNVSLYLSNDARPDWALKVAGTASDAFVIGNSTGANDTCQYPAFSIGTAGAVGVGKTGASNILDITYRNSSTGGIVLTEATNSIASKFISEASSGSIGTTTNSKFGFRTNSATVGAFDTSGNFGIGTDAPGATLDVRGGAIFNEAGGAVDFRVEGDTKANLFFVDGSTDRIGIGTATPGVLFDIDEGDASCASVLMCVNGCICAVGYLGEKQGHTIEDSGVAETQRTGLNFVVTDVGCVVDDSTNDATVVCINGANTCVPFLMCDGSTSDPIALTGGSIGNQLANDSSPCLGGTLNGCDNNVCCVCCICIKGCYFGDGSQLTGVSSVPSSFSADCTIIGCSAGGNVAAGGAKIVLIGGNAGYNATTPSNVVVMGSSAALCMTTATDTVLIGTGSGRCVLTCAGNLALGAWSLYNECAGSFNTALGTCAGLTQKGATTNTFVGAYAGTAVTTGSGNVFVGYKAGCAVTGGNCCLIIGNGTCDLITGVFNTGIVSLVSCVGIGTTAPVVAFHLNNGASVTNLPASTKAVFSNTSAADAITRVGIYAGGASAYAVLDLGRNDANCRSSLTYNTSADSLTIGTAGATSAAIIDTSGNIGIGTTAPQGTSTSFDSISLGGGGFIQSTHTQAAGNTLALAANAHYDTDNSWEYISTDEAAAVIMQNGCHIFNVAASGTAGNDITWTEAMRISSAANIGIGQAPVSPGDSGSSQVAVAINNELILGCLATTNGAISTADSLWINVDSNNNQTSAAINFAHNAYGTSSTILMTLKETGQLGIANTDPADYVDASGAQLVVGCTGTVSGVSIISSTNGRLNFGDGAGDPDQWVGHIQYAHSSNTMGFAVGGNAVSMGLTTTGLGIGTAAPSECLHLYGSSGLSIALQSTHTNIQNTFDITVSDPSGQAGTTAGSGIAFSSNEVDRGFFFRQDGYVGIGTKAPDSLLHIESSGAATAKLQIESTHASCGYPTLTFKNDATTWNVYGANGGSTTAPDAFQIQRLEGGGYFVIETGGSIGIGTGNPGSWGGDAQNPPGGPNNGLLDLVIYNRTSDSAGMSIISCTGDAQTTGYAGINFGDGENYNSKCWNGTFAYFNYGAEFRLQQYCTGNNLHLMNFRSSGATNGIFQSFSCNDPNDTGCYMLRFETTGGNRFYTYSNGNVVNTNNSYGAVSDCNEKCCIADARSYWDDYKNVQFRKFRWKCDNVNDPNVTNSMGVIAQEIEQIWPSIIDCTVIHVPHSHGDILCTADGNACVRKAMKYSVLNVISGKVLQEAVNRIESLEACVIELGG